MSSRKQTQEEIKALESKIKKLKSQMKEYDDADLDEFAKSLNGALMFCEDEYFINVRVTRDGDMVKFKSDWLVINRPFSLPQVAKRNPYGCANGTYTDAKEVLDMVKKGEMRVISDPKEIKEVIDKSIYGYDLADNAIRISMLCQKPSIGGKLTQVTPQNAAEKLLSLNGTLYHKKDKWNDRYTFFRVLDVGDGSVVIKSYYIEFSRREKDSSDLPDASFSAVLNVRVSPIDKRNNGLDKELKSAIKWVNNEIDDATPVNWDELTERMSDIRKHEINDRLYATNGLIKLITQKRK
ncbi:hypothetical protein [Fibrobacter sp.]|uniref:hypothetical protein n=1 Tax=Fibrobacter sp. TaxID=35828 RepID=UPI00386D8256